MTTGVYAITNTVNGKMYIGGSTHITNRYTHHRFMLRRNKHSNRELQEDWNRYGEQSFKFHLLERCSESELGEVENHYYTEILDCYNVRPGRNMGGYSLSEKTKEKMRQAAIEVASRLGESEERSLRAKRQHQEGKFGRVTWKHL